MMASRRFIQFTMLVCVCVSQLVAQPVLEIEEFASGITRPVDIAHAGDSRLFVVGKNGFIRIVTEDGALLPGNFLDITDRVLEAESEQGLLGLAFHPQFPDSPYFYVNYTGGGRATRISRFTVDPNNPNHTDSTTEKILLTIDQPFENHNAGDLAFGGDGYLYIPMGDGGASGDPRNSGQDPKSLLGKIVRIDVDNPSEDRNYGIPEDNPFVGDTTYLDEIWALGLRNPFRFSFDRETQDIWIGDVGQNRREELDYLPADQHRGANFGWKCKEATLDFFADSCPEEGDSVLTAPIFEYVTSASGDGCSVIGGYVYRGSDFPGMYGVYVFADYCSGKMWTVTPDPVNTWDIVDQGVFRRFEIATFGENAAGELFLSYLNQGMIYRVKDASTVSLENRFEAGEVSFFPNPFSEKAVLAFNNPTSFPYEVRVRDLQGRLVYSQKEVTGETVEIDRKSLTAGFYILELRGEKQYAGKIQIQ
ncbi:MAG: PQQ-dependent sugar dehydrogenase [Bacteroidota bacterium]